MHLPAAELLLKQFLKAGDDIISKTPPQENFLALLAEPRFVRSLASLRLLVQHHLPLLVKQLEAWRQGTHSNLARMPERTERDRLAVFSKRASMEVIYFEAALQLLDEYDDFFLQSSEFVAYYDGLQQSAFRLLLIAEDLFPPDLASLYKVVVGEAAKVLGAISRKIALSHVVEPFIRALTERINPKKDASGGKPNYDVLRAQIVRLSSGMRHVALSFESEEAVQQAVGFLRRVHPLAHTAPVKKSQIHHALSEMLTCILLPLVRSDAPQRGASQLGLPALEPWYGTVMAVRNDITSWMNKHQKHVNDGYPLGTTLVCLASDKDYSANIDVTADFLHKGLKVKENRAVCVRCLVILACSYLVRYGAHIIKLELHKWLDRVLKPVTALAKKGGLTLAEQMDVIAPIAELSPEYAVQNLILELLTSDTSDCVLGGLRALQALILTAPSVATAAAACAGGSHHHHQRSSSTAGLAQSGTAISGGFPNASYGSSGGGASISSSTSSSGLQALLRRAPAVSFGGVLYGSTSSVASATSSGGAGAAASGVTASAFAAVNDMLRRGVHPLEVLGVGHLLPRISAALAKLLTTWHPQYGSYVLYSAVDPNWKEKATGMSLLLTLVRLLPYLKPDTWPSVRPLDALPGYTCHVEVSMRSVAVESMLSLIRGCPHLRNTVVCAFTAFTSALPDDAVQQIRDAQALLRVLMELWVALLAERASGDALELTSGGVEALSLDVHRLEGYMMVCLASHDEGVRREAMQILALIRTLHQAVLAAEPYDPPAFPLHKGGGIGAVTRNLSNGGLMVPGSGSTAAATGGRSSHGRSTSRDSMDLSGTDGSTPAGAVRSNTGHGLSDAVEADLTYVIELVEEGGPSLVRATYWDFGDWSDMWRMYKPVPDVTFEEVLAAPSRPGDEVPRVRLARSLVELMALAVRLCPHSAGVAGLEIMARLARMLWRNPDNKLVVLPEYMDTAKRDAWRNCSAVVCACPQALRDRMQEKLGRRPPPITSRDVIRVHLSLLTASSSSSSSSASSASSSSAGSILQLCSMLSLGHLSPDLYVILLEEMQPYLDEYMSNRGAGSSKSKSKTRDEMRRCMSHVLRILSERVPHDVLANSPVLRGRLLEFIKDTYAFMKNLSFSNDSFWEAAQIAYCLTSMVRKCAVPLRALLTQPLQGGPVTPQLGRDSQGRVEAPGASSQSLRKLLWEVIMLWCEEAYILLKDIKAVVASLPPDADASASIRQYKDGNYVRAVTMGISAVLSKYKEPPEGLREELHGAAHYINHSARLALAALLEGPAFDSDTRRPTGPVFTWIDKLLAVRAEGPQPVAGPHRRDVGHRALRSLLTHNPDLFDSCLDKCYDSNYSIASGYFQVMCEVYATQPVRCEPHVVLALVLVKIVDSGQEVREDAMHMLNVLSQREWQSGGSGEGQGAGTERAATPAAAAAAAAAAAGATSARTARDAGAGGADADGAGGGGPSEGAVVVLGGLQDSYQQFQYHLACNLARDHPELSESLCEEMMTRQLECEDGFIQHPVLTSLAPWMENLSISFPWRGNWSERLLKSMYYVTLSHGTKFPSEIQQLWTMLAKRTRNINPILDFLLHLGMATALQTDLKAMLQFFGVGKRIVLYLARVSPTETIGYLAIELAKQQLEDEGSGGGAEGGAGAGGGGGAGAGGGARSGPGGQQQQQQQQQVLVFGGPLDCVVTGEERTLYASYESLPSVSSVSAGGAGSVSGGTGTHDPSGPGGGGGGSNRNRSIDQGHRALSGRSDASGSSRGDANGIGGGLASLADAATGSQRVGLALSGSDPRLRPADDSSALGGGGVDPRLSPSLSRGQSVAGAQSGNRALLTRPELVLCCLPELVYEHEVDPQHLPLLLHVAVTCGDHEEPVVAGHCQQLIVNLLYSISAKFLERGVDLGPAASGPLAVAAGPSSAPPGDQDSPVTSLIRHLQSLRGRRLWPWEEYSLAGPPAVAAAASDDGFLLPSSAALGSLTVAVTQALSYEPDLAIEWAARALDWAQHARSRHAACRSWQVLRALRPPLKADLAAALVLSLEACFQSGYTAGCEVAVEVIATTRVLVQALSPGRLVLYPQVWWSALALLHTPHVAVYRAALGLLAVCVGGGQLRLSTSKVQAVLLAAAPGLSAGQLLAASHAAALQDSAEDAEPWVLGYHVLNVREGSVASPHASVAVQQLLLRGLTHPLTVVPSLHLLAALGDALGQQAQILLARSPGGGSSAASSSGGGAPGLGGPQRPVLSGAASRRSDNSQLQPQAPGGAHLPHAASGGLDGDAADDQVYDAVGGGAGRTSGGATVVPHSDSLRKHRALKLDSFQTLLGSCRSQMFVSLMGLLPLMLSLHGSGGGGGMMGGGGAQPEEFPYTHHHQHGRAARGSGAAAAAAAGSEGRGGGGGGGTAADFRELDDALATAVASLGRAAAALGMPDIGSQLQVLSSPQVAHDPELLESVTTQLLGQLSRALFPRYARWFLHHVADLLLGGTTGGGGSCFAGSSSAPGGAAVPHGPRQVRSALLLLKCLFRVEGLRLGPAAAALVADGTLLQPVVALTGGPLGPLALDALAAAMRYSQEERFQQDLREAASRASPYDSQQQLPRTLFPPATPVAMALKKVVDTLGSGLRRRSKHMKLLPFLGVYSD